MTATGGGVGGVSGRGGVPVPRQVLAHLVEKGGGVKCTLPLDGRVCVVHRAACEEWPLGWKVRWQWALWQ